MFAFVDSFLFLLLAETGGRWETFRHFFNDWFNIPGFEVWKFVNLGLFIAILTYLVKKPLGDAFKAKHDQIRSELIKAEEEKKAALEKLTVAEAKIAQLEVEKEGVLQMAKDEAALEKKRLAEQTKGDVERIRQQAEAEIIRIANQSRASLRRFSAEESIRLAEERLVAQIDGGTDSRLVRASISGIGGLN